MIFLPAFPAQRGFNETYVPVAGTYVQPSVVEIQRMFMSFFKFHTFLEYFNELCFYECVGTIVALPLGPNPARIKCPNCHFDIRTSIDSEPSCAAHLCCLLLLLIGYVMPNYVICFMVRNRIGGRCII